VKQVLIFLLLATSMAVAQCAQGTNGTNCNSPLNVSGSTAAQSSVGLTDNGAAPPEPALSQYWLSINSGTLRVSSNGQPYVLPGMPTNYLLMAQAAGTFSQTVASGAVSYTSPLTQIDMTLPQQVRLVVSSTASTPNCTVQAQYYNGTSWVNLTDAIALNGATVHTSVWDTIPSAANGDYQIRLALGNTGTASATVGLRSATLQFK
jgi:hypothetical protein